MGLGIPTLNIKTLLESNPPKSRILVRRLAAAHICGGTAWRLSKTHARFILSFQQLAFQHVADSQRFPCSHFKCFSLFQVFLFLSLCFLFLEFIFGSVHFLVFLSFSRILFCYYLLCSFFCFLFFFLLSSFYSNQNYIVEILLAHPVTNAMLGRPRPHSS